MKEGWKYRKLGEVATFSRGLTYSKKDEADYSDNIVLRSNNVDLASGKLILDELKYLKSDFIIPEDKYVKKGSLLMCMSNGSKIHLGKVALIEDEKKYAFGGFMGLVTPNESIDSKFLYYALSAQNYKDFINSLSAGANINNIKVRDLEKFVIPIPPLSEQQRIVSRLDASFAKIDALSKQAEESVEHAKALFQAKLKELMEKKEGWEEKKLKECTSSIGDGLHGTPKYYVDGQFFFVNGNNLENGKIEIKADTKRVNKEEYEKYKIDLNETSVLLSINGTVGKTAFYNGEPIILGKSACYMNVLPILSKDFLRYFLMSSHFFDYANKNARQATIKNLGLKEIRAMIVPVPSLSEQKSIVQTLDSLSQKIQQLQQNYNQTLANCQALKQALLKETFE